jgi:ATP-dependent protease Clp ATPase subunit
LSFSDDALLAIAKQAITKGTGARGLRSIMVIVTDIQIFSGVHKKLL